MRYSRDIGTSAFDRSQGGNGYAGCTVSVHDHSNFVSMAGDEEKSFARCYLRYSRQRDGRGGVLLIGAISDIHMKD